MQYQTTQKTFKVQENKRVGNVVIFVEGAKDEFNLLSHIFRKLLGYGIVRKTRNDRRFKFYDELINEKNHSKIYIFNTENSNIGSIEKSTNYINELYLGLLEDHNIDLKNKAVYYIWDRDPDSNSHNKTEEMISKLDTTYGVMPEEEKDYENGLLLLSYPKLEAYTISNFEDTQFLKIPDIKKYYPPSLNRCPIRRHSQKYNFRDMTLDTIVYAAQVMHESLKELGIESYVLDNFKETNLKVFHAEESTHKEIGYYRLLSLVSIIFLDLGIITIGD